MLMVFLLGSYAILKMIRLLSHEQPDFIVNTVLKDMHADYPDPIYANETNFEFAVTFLSILPYKFVKHDPRIGHINMRRVEMKHIED